MKEIRKGHKALNLKPLSHKLTVVYIDTIEDIYTAINARCFDIVARQIGRKEDKIFDIYCDDEGLLKPDYYLSAYGSNQCFLAGDILIAKHDAQGEMIDLPQEDIDYIGKQVYRTFDHCNREIDILFPISYPKSYIYGRSARS